MSHPRERSHDSLAGQPAARAGRFRRWLACAAVLAVAARLAFAFGYWTGKPLTQDEREYLLIGRNLADGKGFVSGPDPAAPPGHRPFSRAPAYPFFLAAVFFAADRIGSGDAAEQGGDGWPGGARGPVTVPGPVKAAQSLVGVVGVVLLALVARRAADAAAGVIAAFGASVYPPLVWLPAYAFSETLFVALALGAILLLTRVLDEGQDRPLWIVFAAGLVAGAAMLTRSAMLVFLGLAALWLVRRRQLAAAVVLAGGALAVVAPWTARNFAVHDRLVLVAADGGVNFWIGNHPLATGEGDMAANPAIKHAYREFEARYPGLSAEQLESRFAREALAEIAEDPGRWAVLLVKKVFYTLVPVGPSYRLHSTRYFLVSLASYLLVLPLAVAGLVRVRRPGWPTVTLVLYAVSGVLVSLVFFPQERYRVPVIDQALIVWASAWIAVTARASARLAPESATGEAGQ